MLIRTPDNRLLFSSFNHAPCELLPYVSPAFLLAFKKELLLIEQLYFCEVFGHCPYLFLPRDRYRVLRLLERHFSPQKISQQLNLPLATIRQLIQELRQRYRLWAHDNNFTVQPPADALKVPVTVTAFSALITDDDFEELADILPNDHGWETARAWSQLQALDILNLLTPAQKQTAIFLEQGFSPAEIGQRLGVSTQEVYQKILRMRHTLTQAGYTSPPKKSPPIPAASPVQASQK